MLVRKLSKKDVQRIIKKGYLGGIISRCNMYVQVGQIWRCNDYRDFRTLKVIEVSTNYIRLQNLDTGRITRAKVSRFDGRTNNYKLVR